MDHGGRQRLLEDGAQEVESRLPLGYPAVLIRFAVRAEHREVDPLQVRAETGAPDDVGYLECPAVREQWQAFFDAFRPWNAFDAGTHQVAVLHPHQGSAVRKDLRAGLPAGRRVEVQ